MADAKVIPFESPDDGHERRGAYERSGSQGQDRRGQRRQQGRRPEQRRPRAGTEESGPAGSEETGPERPGTEAQGGEQGGPSRSGAGAPGSGRAESGTGHGAGTGGSGGESGTEPGGGTGDGSPHGDDGSWERKAARALAFLRRRVTGEYEVDDFGYDAELTDQVLMSVLRPLYEKYFRVEVRGVENIPADGSALVVANHSGTLPLDGLMMQVAVHDNHPAGRHLRLLAADLVFTLPVVNSLARKAGHTLACSEDAATLLDRGEVVGVMPEGFKGLGKPFSERYKLQRFGRGGFVSTALRAGAPIVPCSVVGAEEIYPMVGNAKTLARLLGFPYFPVTPTFPLLGPLGAVPLPTKWTIQFGEPIATDGYLPGSADDPMLVFNLTDQIRETIQHTLYKLLVRRRSVFF